MLRSRDFLTIGEISKRSGLSVSALRFYEAQGLIASTRNSSGHRRFTRAVLRRISFVTVCQNLGYSLSEIAASLAALPAGRTPTQADWETLAEGFRRDLNDRIARMSDLKDKLEGCIGCGCLSMNTCDLNNRQDLAARLGPGPRWLLRDGG